MCQALIKALYMHYLIKSLQQPYEIDVLIIFILQISKVSLRKVSNLPKITQPTSGRYKLSFVSSCSGPLC